MRLARHRRTATGVLTAGTAACLALSGCSAGPAPAGAAGGATGATSVSVTSGESSCEVSTASLPAGQHTFVVSNAGSQVTEVYVYAPGDRIVAEVENVGPSTSRTLRADLPGGSYEVVCKPGMVGNGHRTPLTVTGAAATTSGTDAALTSAVSSYRAYVVTEAQALADATAVFAAAVRAGDLPKARASYAPARLHYERIEPIAESFGALDPLIDMRADDAGTGVPFVGFHALEQLVFARKTLVGAAPLATALTADTATLASEVKTVAITPLTMGNGAKSLLDEVAKSKVTGEEERYSRIDLLDFFGNVDGAKSVVTALRPALQQRDPQLVATLDTRFRALTGLLDTHRSTPGGPGYVPGSPYVSYDALTAPQVKQLAVEVDAISEPLGRVSGAVTGP